MMAWFSPKLRTRAELVWCNNRKSALHINAQVMTDKARNFFGNLWQICTARRKNRIGKREKYCKIIFAAQAAIQPNSLLETANAPSVRIPPPAGPIHQRHRHI
jgi:hypothetical protein